MSKSLRRKSSLITGGVKVTQKKKLTDHRRCQSHSEEKAHRSQEVSSHWQNSPVTVSGVWQLHLPHSQDPRPEQRGADGGEEGGLEMQVAQVVKVRWQEIEIEASGRVAWKRR